MLIDSLPVVGDRELTRDAAIRAGLRHIRKGLYATIAGARPSGTTALLEDIAVPVTDLGETCTALQSLFDEFGYDTAVIFGHAKDGNIHFLITEDFAAEGRLELYREFTERMVELVLGRGGTLKAEHGTGRIMAPFVRRQYGETLFDIMLEIKRAFDPLGTLNPGVVLTLDAELHLRNLKATSSVESEVDRCVECGYCEPGGPSRGVTTTPRQRIVVRRALTDARQRGDTALVSELEKEQRYQVIDTCAVDGMCETACPVRINTGDLVRRLRSEEAPAVARAGWKFAAKHWDALTLCRVRRDDRRQSRAESARRRAQHARSLGRRHGRAAALVAGTPGRRGAAAPRRRHRSRLDRRGLLGVRRHHVRRRR